VTSDVMLLLLLLLLLLLFFLILVFVFVIGCLVVPLADTRQGKQ